MLAISKEFQQELYNGNRDYLLYVDITLKDKTILSFTNDEIWENSFKIEDATSDTDGFNIGSAIINKFTVTIENIKDQYSLYDFEGAEVRVYIGMELPSGRIEKIKKGIYTVDEPSYDGVTITLECLDRMAFFERKYDSTLSYPATLGQIAYDACKNCNVPLKSASFYNSSYIVTSRPADEEITYREIIAYIAQLSACYARFDSEGQLEFKWYDKEVFDFDRLDGGDFKEYELDQNVDGGDFTYIDVDDVVDGGTFDDSNKYHHLYVNSSVKVGTDEIEITGFSLSLVEGEETKEYFSGQEGYVIGIENNPLAQDNIENLVSSIAGQLVGLTFRTFEVSTLDDPSIEAGDPVMISDLKGNTYYSYVTSLDFQIGSYESLSCSAKTTSENESVRYNIIAKNIVATKKEFNQKLNDYQYQFNQFNNLFSNAMGFYMTKEEQEDGSMIAYLHEKPELSQSQTIWKISVDGFAVSLNGGQTWTTGITKDGNIIANVLSVVGINADWITAGIINAIEMIGCTIRGSYIESKSGNDRTVINNGTMITNRIILENESDTSNSGYLTPSVLVLASSNGNRVNIDTSNGYVQLPSNGFFNVGSASLKTDELQLGIRSGKTRPIINGMEIPYTIDLQNNYVNRDKYNEDLKYIYENYTLKAIFDLHTHDSTAINAIPYTGTEIDSLGVSTGYIDFNNADAAGFYYVKRISAKVASMNTSDFRLKKDLQQIDGIENIYLNLKPYNYRFKECSEFYNKKIHSGVLAQEVINNFEENGLKWTDYDLIETFKPDSELSDEGQYVGEQGYRVNYNNLHAWHIYMIQQQQRQINNLQEENKALKSRLDQIEDLLLNKSEVNS